MNTENKALAKTHCPRSACVSLLAAMPCLLIAIMVSGCGVGGDVDRLANGQSEAEVVAIMGNPTGRLVKGDQTVLLYYGVKIELLDGKTVGLNSGFGKRISKAKKSREGKPSAAETPNSSLRKGKAGGGRNHKSINRYGVLTVMSSAKSKVKQRNIVTVERAKGFMMLPAGMHSGGRDLEKGIAFGMGEFTEANLMACIDGVDSLSELDVGGDSIVVGKIGELPYYERREQ